MSDIKIGTYNSFCKGLMEGNILYNIDSTNQWGEYLLVANITPVEVGSIKTYTVLLIGLKKEEGRYIPKDTKVSLNPSYAGRIPFLKPIGYCKFSLVPAIEEVNVHTGLAAIYGNTDLHKYAANLSIRKPRAHKYDMDGKPIVRKPGNK